MCRQDLIKKHKPIEEQRHKKYTEFTFMRRIMKKNHQDIADKIYIQSDPMYLEEESAPSRDRFFWAYHITIKNTSNEVVRLRRRHWIITESRGVQQEIRGDGVVGQEPILQPGESFVYTSGALLSSPSGMMEGGYEMECNGGEIFRVPVPAFSLDSPHEQHLVH